MILIRFTRAYPWQSLLMVLALLAAGLAEGFSITALLPLLSMAVESGGGGVAESELASSQFITNMLERIGVTPSVLSLLVVVVVGITLKSLLVLLANRQVGYTKARVTTDLRLRLLRAVMGSRWDYFVHQPVGRLTNRMATEAWRSAIAYEFGVSIFAYAIQALVYLGVAVMVSWKATVSSIVAAGVILLLSHSLVEMTRSAGKRRTNLLKSLLSRLTDTLASVKTLKAMGRENLADGVLQAETSNLNRALE